MTKDELVYHMVKSKLIKIFSYSAKRLLSNTQIRSNVGQWNAINKCWIFLDKIYIACSSILRNQRTYLFQFLDKRTIGYCLNYCFPFDDCGRNFFPVSIGKYQ